MKNRRKVMLVAVMTAVFSHPLLGGEPVAPEGWQRNSNMDVDATESLLRHALENTDGTMSQQTTNRFLRAVASMQDARLFVIYTRLFEMLETGERAKLYREQTQWLKKRGEHAKDAASTDAGGSAETADYWGAFADDTVKRQKEMQKRINSLSKKDKE